MGKGVPLIAPQELRLLFARLSDATFMLEVFRRELPPLAGEALRVTQCRLKTEKSRTTLRQQKLRVVYRVMVEHDGSEEEHIIVGTAPVPSGEPGDGLAALCDAARGHPLAGPFRCVTGHVADLRMTFQLFPVDVAMPALLEITRPDCGALLSPFLTECREGGASVEGVRHEVKHYRPGDRCVLRLIIALRGPTGTTERVVYAKVFAGAVDAQGIEHLRALSHAMERSRCLHPPEILGYDPRRRILYTAEAPGPKLSEWIKCLEKDQPLPAGVDEPRLLRCMALVAQGLHELHECGVRLARRRTMRDVVAGLREDLDWMERAQPDLAAEARGVLDRLAAIAPDDAPLVPAHGCFSHKQMIGDDHGLIVLDWDGMAMAHPAMDAADFLARLRQEARRNPGGARGVDRLADAFRREFLAREPAVTPRDLAAHKALAIVEKAVRSFRRPGEEGRMTGEIRRQLAAARELLALPS